VSDAAPPAAGMAAPALRRRMACFVYEGVLLFGVVMMAGLVYGITTRQQHALVGTTGLQVFTFIVLGVYFVFLWSRSGQTLAMQTWHIRLVTHDGQPVSRLRALCRYLLAWLWFLPALAILWWSGLKGSGATFVALLTGVLAYAALAWLHPQRQFWHDAVCGTCLINWKPARRN
jgi:uncharacterized RDD family membrane protein YckC